MNPVSLIGPLILIGLGILFLLNNFGLHLPFRYIFRELWPFVIILIGVAQLAIFFAAGVRSRPGHLTAGLILVTVGGLFALQNLFHVPFRNTWPMILIAVGVAGVLRFDAGETVGRWTKGGSRR